MKNKVTLLITIIGAAALIVGCDTFSTNQKPPSATEARLFDVQTNYVPITVTVTNVVQHTNTVMVTNAADNTVSSSEVVTGQPVVSQEQTNKAVYSYNPRPGVTGTITALGNASSPFTAGIGTMVASGLVALYGLWGHMRSSKLVDTSTALTQEIEAIRSFILTLPQGTKVDAAVTQFMQQHQTEAGVAQTVLKLIDGNTSDPTITGISKELQDTITALTK